MTMQINNVNFRDERPNQSVVRTLKRNGEILLLVRDELNWMLWGNNCHFKMFEFAGECRDEEFKIWLKFDELNNICDSKLCDKLENKCGGVSCRCIK